MAHGLLNINPLNISNNNTIRIHQGIAHTVMLAQSTIESTKKYSSKINYLIINCRFFLLTLYFFPQLALIVLTHPEGQ